MVYLLLMMHNLPPGVTEQSLLDSVENAIRVLAKTFSFGIWDKDDIAQEARMEAFRVIHRYDPRPDANGRPTRPLDCFIFRCVKNRLIRLKRDFYRRNDPPCRRCHNGDPCGPDGKVCSRYAAWDQRQTAKTKVRQPLPLDGIADQNEPSTVEADVETRELLRLVDDQLPVEMRADWLRLRAGRPVHKKRREEIEEALREILGDAVA